MTEKVDAISKQAGETVFNLSPDLANADFIRAARLAETGKVSELKELEKEAAYTQSSK